MSGLNKQVLRGANVISMSVCLLDVSNLLLSVYRQAEALKADMTGRSAPPPHT